MALVARWSKEAEDTFDDIIAYLTTNWTEKEIQNFVRKVHKVIVQIEKNPYQFKTSQVQKIRKAFITKNNSLFYFVKIPNQHRAVPPRVSLVWQLRRGKDRG